jgi:hypothetical protein
LFKPVSRRQAAIAIPFPCPLKAGHPAEVPEDTFVRPDVGDDPS